MRHGLTTRQATRERIRAVASTVLDGAGYGFIDVYKVPIGYELEVRRVQIELGSIRDDGTNLGTACITLNGFPTYAEYLRSGTRIEWAAPMDSLSNSVARLPGVQTWGREQGPYLRNGEIFQFQCGLGVGVAFFVPITVTVEGILTKAGSTK